MGVFDIFFGNKKAAINNAAELLMQKIAAGEFDVQIDMFSENNSAEIYDITNIERLAEYLEEKKNIKNAEKHGVSAFAGALLNAISVIRTPDFEKRNFSLCSLKQFSEISGGKLQQQATQIVIIMVSLMEAKYDYARKNSESAKQKIETACLLLEDSVTVLNEQIIDNNTQSISGTAIAIQELYGPFWSLESENNPLNAFFSKSSKKIKNDFYSFLASLFSELSENKQIFGKSAPLRELVKRYKTELYNYQKPADPIFPSFPVFSLKNPSPVNPFFIISIITIIGGFIFFPIIAGAGFLCLIISIILLFSSKKKYQAALDVHQKQCDEVQRECEKLSQEYEEKCRAIKDFYDSLENYFS